MTATVPRPAPGSRPTRATPASKLAREPSLERAPTRATEPAPAAVIAELLTRRLRPAVTAIYTAAEIVVDPLTAERMRTMAAWTVAREALRLMELTQDLGVLVRADGAIPPPTRPAPLSDVLGRRLAAYAGDDESRLVVDVPPDLPSAPVDPVALEHAVGNLVRSALANAPRDGRVTVRAGVVPGAVRIVVRDGGPLPHSRANDPFALSRDAGRPIDDGSGMNLSLHVARRLVESVGGTIQASGGPSGTELVVTLPI
jgi:signal transduction histidine kinase